jgi:hypothetical protein
MWPPPPICSLRHSRYKERGQEEQCRQHGKELEAHGELRVLNDDLFQQKGREAGRQTETERERLMITEAQRSEIKSNRK